MTKASSGTLQLSTPIRAGGEDVTELQYDFQKLTGWEYAEALDSDKNATTIFRLTAKQALNLFATAAGKATTAAAKAADKEARGIDANDIKERIGVEDSMAAVQLAIVFFNACALKRNKRTTSAVADAAIASHTPINAFMDMTIPQFYDFYNAIRL